MVVVADQLHRSWAAEAVVCSDDFGVEEAVALAFCCHYYCQVNPSDCWDWSGVAICLLH